MITEGWGTDELPASVALRSVLSGESSPEERRALRREQAEADVRRARAQDTADSAAAAVFMARMRGETVHGVADVLAGAAGARDGLDVDAHSRRREAVAILRRHGLADVLGAPSGVVLDANLGVLERPVDERARARLDFEYESGRSERAAEARRAYVDGLKVSRRSRGLDTAPTPGERQAAAEAPYRHLPEFESVR